ncbi:NTE family protein [Salsuginibacillus halophilus]|uniref:NTE family protein n=1 Tax=Salsuginibacillus halophilus TaxID=517424 RepID=A0A2P8HAF4_9BACI|nr:patatin-like phospholipase family protein [Salsuginibacillus halophilus]PSL43180.1 NTE family protein [Salsuginibacillus halophilus]
MNVDAVFAGGGVKAVAFIGALRAMEQKNLSMNRVAGTSAGALTAALVKAGYTSDELLEIVKNTDPNALLDAPFPARLCRLTHWLSVYWRLGLYKGEALEEWIEELLAKKMVRTFRDLPEGSLRIVASDLSAGRFMVLPDDLKEYGYNPDTFPIAKAVRMSCALPYFFEPVKLKQGRGRCVYVVDGGVLSNFPLWLFKNEQEKLRRPLIGFQLKPEIDAAARRPIENAVEMYKSLFETMRKAHDLRYIKQTDAEHIVFIPADQLKATDFQAVAEDLPALIELGEKAAEDHITRRLGRSSPIRKH